MMMTGNSSNNSSNGTMSAYARCGTVRQMRAILRSVWVGFDQPQPIGTDAYGARYALPTWADFMQRAGRIRVPSRSARGRAPVIEEKNLTPHCDSRAHVTTVPEVKSGDPRWMLSTQSETSASLEDDQVNTYICCSSAVT